MDTCIYWKPDIIYMKARDRFEVCTSCVFTKIRTLLFLKAHQIIWAIIWELHFQKHSAGSVWPVRNEPCLRLCSSASSGTRMPNSTGGFTIRCCDEIKKTAFEKRWLKASWFVVCGHMWASRPRCTTLMALNSTVNLVIVIYYYFVDFTGTVSELQKHFASQPKNCGIFSWFFSWFHHESTVWEKLIRLKTNKWQKVAEYTRFRNLEWRENKQRAGFPGKGEDS